MSRHQRQPARKLGSIPEGRTVRLAGCPDLAVTVVRHGPMGTVCTLVRPTRLDTGPERERAILSNGTEVRP